MGLGKIVDDSSRLHPNEGIDYKSGDLRIGVLAQPPEGKSAKVAFDNIVFRPSRIANAWTGQ